MPTPVTYLSGGTLGYQSGMFKRGTMSQGFGFPLVNGFKWWNGINVTSSQYLIYSDQYTMGTVSQANSIPVAWSTPDLTDASLLALINTLPPRIGLPGFTSLSAALNWLQSTNQFFLIKNDYENVVTSNLQLLYDAGWYTSYAGTGTAVTDLSGNGRTGTMTNGVTFNSSGVGYFNFDGADDYITSTGPTFTNQVTFNCWFRTTLSQTNRHIMAMAKNIGSGNNGLDLYVDPTSVGSYLATASSFANPTFTTTYYDNQWHMLTITYDNSNAKLYYDGILRTTASLTGNLSIEATKKFTLGSWVNAGSNFSGNISMCQIYVEALTAEQVLQNYNTQKARFDITSPVQTNMVLQLDAGNPISYPGTGTLWTDISGYANNGTLTNGPTFSSSDGGYISFDGTDDYTLLTNAMNSLVGTNQVTFAAWVYRNSVPGYWAGIISNKVNLTDGISLLINPSSKIFWQYDSTSGVYAIDGGATLSTGIWYYIAGVYDSVGLKTYLNGVLNDSAADSGKSIASNGNMNINVGAQEYFGPASYFPGRISRVEIYKKGLTAPELQQNFYAFADRYGVGIARSGLVLNFDGGNFASYPTSGTTWYDISGNVFDSTLVNSPTYSTTGAGSIYFDGTDDYGILNTKCIPTGNQITICFWNYGVSAPSSSIIAASFNSSDQTLNIHLPWSNNNIYWDCGYPFNRINKYATNAEYQGWHHWVFTKNATTGNMYIYLDGSLWHSGSGLTSTIPAMDVAKIGSYWTGGINHIGYIGQCQIYNREISSSEVTQNFNASRSRYGL